MRVIRFTSENPQPLQDRWHHPASRGEETEGGLAGFLNDFLMIGERLTPEEVVFLPCIDELWDNPLQVVAGLVKSRLHYKAPTVLVVINDRSRPSFSRSFYALVEKRVVKGRIIEPMEGSLVDLEALLDQLVIYNNRVDVVIVQTYNYLYGLEYTDEVLAEFIKKMSSLGIGARVLFDAKYSLLHYRRSILTTLDNRGLPAIAFVTQTNTALASVPGTLILLPGSFENGLREKGTGMEKGILQGLDSCTHGLTKHTNRLLSDLAYIASEGFSLWIERHKRKAQLAYNRLIRYGFMKTTDSGEYLSMFFPSFIVPYHKSSKDIVSYLGQKGFILDQPVEDKLINIPTMGYTTLPEFNALLETIILYTI